MKLRMDFSTRLPKRVGSGWLSCLASKSGASVRQAFVALVLAWGLSSCERPQLASEEAPDAVPQSGGVSQAPLDSGSTLEGRIPEGKDPAPAVPPPLLANGGGTGGKADPAGVAKGLLEGDGAPRELPAPERNEPFLRVFWNAEGHIVVEGAIQSRFQREDIIAVIGEAFSGVRVDDRLELDYDRIPMGWLNRVADEFLVPFLQDVEGGFVEYYEGIITMSGKASRMVADHYQHGAVTVFDGPYSRDIVNQIAP